MTCQREGCKRDVPPGRFKYCSAECADTANRANARVKGRERTAAQRLRTQAFRPDAKMRECVGLGCINKRPEDRMFWSTGRGHRQCPTCWDSA